MVVKSWSLTPRLLSILPDSRVVEARGTVGVVVKCVDIDRNTKGEGNVLEHF